MSSALSQAKGPHFVFPHHLVLSQPPSSSFRQSSSHVPCFPEIFAACLRRVLAAKKSLAVVHFDKFARGMVDECNASEWVVKASTHDACPLFLSPPARHLPPLYNNHCNPRHHSNKSLRVDGRLGVAAQWHVGRWLWEEQHHHTSERSLPSSLLLKVIEIEQHTAFAHREGKKSTCRPSSDTSARIHFTNFRILTLFFHPP